MHKMTEHPLPKILIVDDLANNRAALAHILTQVAATVISVASGNEALAMCTRHDFALVLLDVTMPVMDGLEVAGLLRMREKSRHLPILFLTGQANNLDQKIKGYASGAVDFILKPIDSQILLAKVNVFVELYRKRSLLEQEIAQLAQQKKELENEILERKRVEQMLESQLLTARLANQSTHAFLANMSHEMRTSLNAISGLTNLALRCELHPDARDYLIKIAQSSSILTQINNDVGDCADIGAGKISPYATSFTPSEMFDHLATQFVPQAADKGMELLFLIPDDFSPTLHGDAKRLEQILIHLLRNTIRFNHQGTVIVRAHPHPPQTGAVTVHCSVQDSGEWINPERINALFASLTHATWTLDAPDHGSALEIHTAKQLVEMMGGQIWVETLPGQGGLLHFTVQMENRAPSNPSLIMPECLRGIKILVADDHEQTRDVVTRMLRKFDFTTHAVDSGEAAMEELQRAATMQTPYQLIFLDWRMAGMDGIETARAIQKQFGQPGPVPKIIMLTAFGKQTIQQNARESGIDLFVHKPVTHVTLFNAILEAFGERALIHQHADVAVMNEEMALSRKIGGARILLAEDNHINRQVARELLERVGLIVESANNGQEVLEKLRTASCDAILMDVQMPVLDGLAATRAIRMEPQFARLPIIAMTAHVQENALQECLAAGMNDHITKPIDIQQLYAALVRWINPNDTKAGSMDPGQPSLTPMLDTLSRQLQSNDTDAEHTCKTLQPVIGKTHCHDDWKRMEERIQRLDYPGAHVLLKKIQIALA